MIEHSCEGELVKSETPNDDARIHGESQNNEDNHDYSKNEEVYYEVIPKYNPNYPLLVKWTNDHPKIQVICNP